jgi:hypothetical protein
VICICGEDLGPLPEGDPRACPACGAVTIAVSDEPPYGGHARGGAPKGVSVAVAGGEHGLAPHEVEGTEA